MDAVKVRRLAHDPPVLEALDRLLADLERDEDLWAHLTSGDLSWPAVLGLLGWDPREAECRFCASAPAVFRLRDQDFFCRNCAFKLGKDQVIWM